MNFYKNPPIGWFLKKRIKKIIAISILVLIFYFIIMKTFTHKNGSGCNRPDCYSTPCTGFKCKAQSCNGNNCKGADCIGEDCSAGDCYGVGCRAGDCYGLYCTPGKCIDTSCDFERMMRGECTPFCRNGRPYSIPRNNIVYPFIKYLPRNSPINPDYCSPQKRSIIFTSDTFLHNFSVDEVTLFTSGRKNVESVKNPDKLQDGKSFIITQDTDFISSTPNVYKSDNCEWCTKFKGNEIISDYKPIYDDRVNEDNSSWKKKSYLAIPLNDEDEPLECSGGDHNMQIQQISTVLQQINTILSSNLPDYQKKFKIDQVEGEKLSLICNLCNNVAHQYLDVKGNITLLDSSIKPCIIRCYELNEIFDKPDSAFKKIIGHEIKNYKQFIKDSVDYNDYISKSVNQKKTFNDHHLWTYDSSVGNTQLYKCYFCNEIARVNYKSLPRDQNGNLLPCRQNNDFNHYMYDLLDNDKNVYQKCLKCDKKSYPYLQ